MSDPITRVVADLPALLPCDAHDRHVRARCHAALARRRKLQRQPPRPFRIPDLIAGAGAALYVAAVLVEAARFF